MDLGIKGKNALVLGGATGIGNGIAKALAAEGVNVAIASRNLSNLEKACKDLGKYGVSTLAVPIDLGDHATIEQGFTKVTDSFGQVDILVNNTGGPPPGGVLGLPEENWRTQFEAMVLSVIRLTDLAVPAMRARKWGRVITIGSAGVVQPVLAIGVSNTLRSALVGWSKTLAMEVARDGVTVNMLLPATTRTNRIASFWKAESDKTGKSIEEVEAAAAAALPTGRYGTIEEFGAVAAFIASVQAGYVTGSMIRVDGGFLTAV